MTPLEPARDHDEERLEALVAEVLLAEERGERDASTAAASACPELADELARRLARLRSARGLLADLGAPREPELPRALGGHTLLRELGRGGMGVVYLARDERLGRTVALKAVAHPALAGERGRARFEREVRAVAALSHPGIVPILEAGEDDGTPYYTMPYVAGRSLADALAELRELGEEPARLTGARLAGPVGEREDARDAATPQAHSYPVQAARIALDVADALAHAHAHGLVHRDVKPSNVLLTSAGRALLCDFGLARDADARGLTRSGDLVGTPHYLAPEQAAGATVDARADVYALGATLYELLTLRPPHEGRTTAELLRRVQTREPAPVRRLNPAVPRDLETLCATALAKEPARRYGSAAELADDLRRFLAYRPVTARPVGPATRALRWTRRNPMTAVAAGSLALVVLVGPTVFALQSRAAARRVQREQAATLVQRDRADRNVERVLHTVDELLTRVSEEELVHLPRMDELRRELLERALRLYDELLAEDDGSGAVRRDTARVLRSAGDLQLELGRLDEAEATSARAVELATALYAAPDAAPRDAEELAAALVLRAALLERRGALAAAEAPLLRALALREQRAAAEPDAREAAEALANAHHGLGTHYLLRGRHADGERELREAVRRFDALSRGAPEDAALRASRARALVALASLLLDAQRSDEAWSVAREALGAWRDVLAHHPSWFQARLGTLRAAGTLADLTAQRGELDESFALIDEALALGEDLCREHPTVPEYAESLAATYEVRMGALARAGRLAEAAAAGREALARLDAVAADHPDLASLARRRAIACDELARVHRAAGDGAAELAALRESVAARRAWRAAGADSPAQRSRLGGALNNLARATAEAGDPRAGLALLAEAAELQRSARAAAPDERQYGEFLSNHLWGTCKLALEVGELQRCVDAARELGRLGLDGGGEERSAAGWLALAVDAGADASLVPEAIELLRAALAQGGADRAELASAPDLASLRDAPAFAALLAP